MVVAVVVVVMVVVMVVVSWEYACSSEWVGKGLGCDLGINSQP
jgi:hypothetical protein